MVGARLWVLIQQTQWLSTSNTFAYGDVQCRVDDEWSKHPLLLFAFILLRRCPHCGICISLLRMSRVRAHDSLPMQRGSFATEKKDSTSLFHGWIYCQSVHRRWHVLEVRRKAETRHSSEASRFQRTGMEDKDGVRPTDRCNNLLFAQCTNEVWTHILSTRSPRLWWRRLFTFSFRNSNGNGK